MKQGRSTGKPTKAQERRFLAIKEGGCVACIQDGRECPGCEIHHMNLDDKAGQKRLGHDHTFGLCPWHHRGSKPNDVSRDAMERWYGPSMALDKAAFTERYGSQAELLGRQNEMIGAAA